MATLNPGSGLRLFYAMGPCAFTLRILDSMLCRHQRQFVHKSQHKRMYHVSDPQSTKSSTCPLQGSQNAHQLPQCSDWGSVPLKTLTKAVHLCDTSLAAVAMPIAPDFSRTPSFSPYLWQLWPRGDQGDMWRGDMSIVAVSAGASLSFHTSANFVTLTT